MSFVFYVVFENGEDAATDLWSGLYFDSNGLGLTDAVERQGLMPLRKFLSNTVEQRIETARAYEYTLSAEELNNPEEWFEPDEGLKTTRALLDHLRNRPLLEHSAALREKKRTTKACIEYLEALEVALLRAQRQGTRFHLTLLG